MSKDHEEIKKLIQDQAKKIDEIHFSIYGNPKADVKGMAQTVSEHEKYIANDKKFKWTVAGAMTGGLGGLWAYIKSHLGF